MVVAALVWLLGACAPAADAPSGRPAGTAADQPASAPAATVAAAAPAPAGTGLVLLTGSATGGIHRYGTAFAALATEEVAGLSLVAEVTGGSVENLAALIAGRADIGISVGDVLAAAVTRSGAFAGLGPGELNVLAVIAIADLELFFVVRGDLADDLAHALTATLVDRRADVAARAGMTSAPIEERTLALAVAGVRLHPGSVRYFEDAGAVVPDALSGG